MEATVKSRKSYSTRIRYENEEANLAGTVGTIAGFSVAKTTILANTDLASPWTVMPQR